MKPDLRYYQIKTHLITLYLFRFIIKSCINETVYEELTFIQISDIHKAHTHNTHQQISSFCFGFPKSFIHVRLWCVELNHPTSHFTSSRCEVCAISLAKQQTRIHPKNTSPSNSRSFALSLTKCKLNCSCRQKALFGVQRGFLTLGDDIVLSGQIVSTENGNRVTKNICLQKFFLSSP